MRRWPNIEQVAPSPSIDLPHDGALSEGLRSASGTCSGSRSQAFRQFKQDPSHSSLRFKQVHSSQPIFSARVGLGYRALAVGDQDVYIWFWIGTHGDYDRLLKDL